MTKKQSKLVLALVIGIGATLTVLLGVLGAVESSAECESGDVNATCENGNLAMGNASCALFATPNGEEKYWIGQESSSGTLDDYVTATSFGTYLNITRVGSPAVILGSVIKAGTAYNVYYGAILSGLNAPVNDGGQEPQISHWTVCYYFPEVVETTTTAPTTTTPEITTTVPTTTTTEATTTTTTGRTTTTDDTTTTTDSTTTTTDGTTTTTTGRTTTTEAETTTTDGTTTTSTSTPPATSTSTTEATTTTTEAETSTTEVSATTVTSPTSTTEVSETTVTGPTSTTTPPAETTTTNGGGSEELPRTGASAILLLLIIGGGLVGLGYALVATTKNSSALSD